MDTSSQLTDGIILLRPPGPADIPDITNAVRESMVELHPWMDWATSAYDEAAAARWVNVGQIGWEHASRFQFVIIDAITGEYLGNCIIDGIDRQKEFCNIGYWVRTSRTGQGIASCAIRLAARFAFESVGVERAELVIATTNLPSQQAARKAGAHHEGLSSKPLVIHTAIYHANIYSLTSADFGFAPHR